MTPITKIVDCEPSDIKTIFVGHFYDKSGKVLLLCSTQRFLALHDPIDKTLKTRFFSLQNFTFSKWKLFFKQICIYLRRVRQSNFLGLGPQSSFAGSLHTIRQNGTLSTVNCRITVVKRRNVICSTFLIAIPTIFIMLLEKKCYTKQCVVV